MTSDDEEEPNHRVPRVMRGHKDPRDDPPRRKAPGTPARPRGRPWKQQCASCTGRLSRCPSLPSRKCRTLSRGQRVP